MSRQPTPNRVGDESLLNECLQIKRDTMDLTKHKGATDVSSVFTDVQDVQLPNVIKSNLSSKYKELINKRKQSVGCLGGNSLIASYIPVVEIILQCIAHGGKIMAAGNGGSASQSQHFCSELMGRLKNKRSPIRAISLCSDISLVTCIANDFGYERIFSRQIEGLGNTNDIFVAFTTSGTSRNILEALLECKSRGVFSIVFTGRNADSVNRLADYVVSIPFDESTIVQEIHMQLIHVLCEIVESSVIEVSSFWSGVLELEKQGYKYLILDRDGVINHIKPNGYVLSPSEFEFRRDFLDVVKELSDAFQYVFVVSNQKGVGKGLMTEEELELVHRNMIKDISNCGGRIDKIYVSTSADNNAADSKPNIGLAEKIKEDYPAVDFKKTVVVGDSVSDYLFADNLTCKFVYARTR